MQPMPLAGCGFAAEISACIATGLMTFQVLPDHFADEEQEIWLPAYFAIPWLLGQQVRHQKQQLHQAKENGHQMKLKKSS